MPRWRRPGTEKADENQRHQLPANHQRRESLPTTVSFQLRLLRRRIETPTKGFASMQSKNQVTLTMTGRRREIESRQLTGHKEGPNEPQTGSSTLKPEDPQPPHVKEEERELKIPEEGKFLLEQNELTGVLKTEDPEDEPPKSLLWLCPLNIQQLIGHQKHHPQPQGGSFTLKQEGPQTPHVKEEEEELWITHGGEFFLGPKEADLSKTGVSVKNEDKPPESSQLHHIPGEENRWVEPPSSSSPQHMTPEADGDHCGGSQADNLLAPLSHSEDTTSHSSVGEDRDDTQEPLSSDTDWEGDIRTPTDNKHSESSKKKTRKKRLPCSVCAKSFSSKSHLTQHMLTHTGEKPFTCTLCGKNYSYRRGLTHHMLMHTGEKPFGCSVCGHRFTQKSLMESHMRRHTGEKPFSCSVCAKNFSYKANLTDHMLKHTGVKRFGCPVCGRRFLRKAGMVLHMTTHTREKRFSCSVCGKIYSYKRSLTYHMVTHTGEKPFDCSICGKTFSHKSLMVSHIKRHTGEKPFGCSVCGQRFPRKSRMVSHMATHTGQKPFSCSICRKSYSYKHLLNAHMLTHTDKKPFGCSVCGQRFLQKSLMVSHKRTHSGDKACQEGSGYDTQPKHYWNQKGFEWSF